MNQPRNIRHEELSEDIYNILYKNDKPCYTLTKMDFMKLLFISDELSNKPIIAPRLTIESLLEMVEEGSVKRTKAISFYCRVNGYTAENIKDVEEALYGN